MKFGGSAIDSVKKMNNVAELIKGYKSQADHKGKSDSSNEIVVVVSALRGMTDSIINVCDKVRKGLKEPIYEFIQHTRKVHLDIIENGIEDNSLKSEALLEILPILDELRDVLEGLVLLSEVTPKSMDYLLSFGERLSTPLVSFFLLDHGLKSRSLTAKDIGILTNSEFGEASPLMDTTKLRVSHNLEILLKDNMTPVVTGFIGVDQNGSYTTIGRGGSDFSATIIGLSVQANEVWLWSDVDGLMTADPKIVKTAKVLREVSFTEAMEMALFGAKYIHPRALEPAIEAKIPVRIRNTFNTQNVGTLITSKPSNESQKTVKSINTIRNTALIDVSGSGMVGAPGTAAKIFDTLAKNRVNIMMISQSPSESSISMVVRKNALDKATNMLEINLLGKVIKKVNVNNDVAVIAVVGSGMRGIKGVAAKVFGAIAKRDVNVIMITQGYSELNLALVVNNKDCEEAVNALHMEFELS
ncbi:MAG TPA: aspartate kinase [Nitrososphaeraceae archaeon]|jgi:aspartate kinase